MVPVDNFETVAALAEADALVRSHDQAGAIARLERAIRDDVVRADAGPPSRSLYIRLATLYRAYERYRDELALLESFLDRYPDDGQRTRFHSRLSKLESIIGAGRTSSVVPVNHASRTRARRSRVSRRLSDQGRRLEQAGQPRPAESTAVLRQRAASLLEDAAATLRESTAAASQQARRQEVMAAHKAALRELMADFGADLAARQVARDDVGTLVRELLRAPAASEVAEVSVVTGDAEEWCLEAYDAA